MVSLSTICPITIFFLYAPIGEYDSALHHAISFASSSVHKGFMAAGGMLNDVNLSPSNGKCIAYEDKSLTAIVGCIACFIRLISVDVRSTSNNVRTALNDVRFISKRVKSVLKLVKYYAVLLFLT